MTELRKSSCCPQMLKSRSVKFEVVSAAVSYRNLLLLWSPQPINIISYLLRLLADEKQMLLLHTTAEDTLAISSSRDNNIYHRLQRCQSCKGGRGK